MPPSPRDAWHQWRAWGQASLWLPFGVSLASRVVILPFLFFFSTVGQGALGSLWPQGGEKCTCLLMQWVASWAPKTLGALASLSTHCYPWPPARAAAWCGEGPQCTHRGLPHPQLQTEPCKLLFGDREEGDSYEAGAWKWGNRNGLHHASGLSPWMLDSMHQQHSPSRHLVWPSILLSISIMERNNTPENFLHPDCKNRVKVGHFLCYFRAHSLLLKHIM